MKIAVISDLHLGRGDRSDRFGHDDAEFLQFLNYLEGNFERIVLLGDIYETLQSPRPMDQVRELQAVRAAHPEIAHRFKGEQYRYVHGNHDLVASHVDSAPTELLLNLDGVKVLFTHGHLHDWMLRHARWFSETGVWLGGWLLRWGLDPVIRMFDVIDNVTAGVHDNPLRCSFQRWAIATAHARNADVVVTGHTHVGIKAEHGDRLFLNSGSCSGGDVSFLSLDTGTGQYGVHHAF